eukprot:TRINITY_DN4878_c0_g1_i1.p1 TRINITY_DN4878_c0_g1~~TRINITY_DN4878_c0_g1_i1.p1  ORF type:complete len:123 (-),score=45.13 TRINITY_DN4878_c0_g1_i1:150-470(-)
MSGSGSKKKKYADQQSKQLEGFGGYKFEEEDGDEGEPNADISILKNIDDNDKEEEKKRELLLKVKIEQEDVQFLMKEMELKKGKAELALRENDGDLSKTLAVLVNS